MAKAYYRMSIIILLFLNLLIIGILYLVKDWVISLFTHNPEIIEPLIQIWPLMLFFVLI